MSGFFILKRMNQESANIIFETISNANKIVIVAHKAPDGDSIGSSLALFHFLQELNIQANICHPDKAPDFLEWMPGFSNITTHEESPKEVEEIFNTSDVLICLDFNSPTRVGKMESLLRNFSGKKIMIDHHLDPDTKFFDAYISESSVCSTAQLIYEFIESQDKTHNINLDCAACIYTGIMTDTGSFRFSSVNSKTHEIGAFLLRIGLDQSKIHEKVFDQTTEDQIKLTSYTLLEKLVIRKDLELAYISLTLDELEKFNAKKGDTEGLVNRALGIKGVKMAVFLKEDVEIVKMSFRSKGSIPVNKLAQEHFEGGGHLNAAGGKVVGKMNLALQKLVTILPNFVNENKAVFNEIS